MVGASILIRAALPEEATALSELALRSKAHWGYDDAFLAACRRELTVSRARIERDVAAVLEKDGVAQGFYLLRAEGGSATGACHQAELELFFLDPSSIGEGNGRRLWLHAVASAREYGYRRIIIHSDPHAEGFYLAMGARRVGEVASGSVEGRSLPLMQLDLDGGEKGPEVSSPDGHDPARRERTAPWRRP